jgi:NADPH:quinone reductase-like Zn-dependent oxidoreductase
MHAMVIDGWGGPETLHEAEVEAPPVSPDFVLIRNHAAGHQPRRREDPRGQARGRLPLRLPADPGLGRAGTVEKVGPAVTMFRPGDEVFAYCRRHHLQYGTYGEYTAVPDAFVARKPESLSWEEAGRAPARRPDRAPVPRDARRPRRREGLHHRRGRRRRPPRGADGGRPRRARVRDRLAREPRLAARARAEPLDYGDEDICARVREEGGADAAIDLFGGEGRKQAFACLRSGGRLVSIALPAPEPSDVAETHYVFVRPSGFDLHELAELVDGRPHQAARRGGLPARARRRRARAHRGRPHPRQARPQRFLVQPATTFWMNAKRLGTGCPTSLGPPAAVALLQPLGVDEEVHDRLGQVLARVPVGVAVGRPSTRCPPCA